MKHDTTNKAYSFLWARIEDRDELRWRSRNYKGELPATCDKMLNFVRGRESLNGIIIDGDALVLHELAVKNWDKSTVDLYSLKHPITDWLA